MMKDNRLYDDDGELSFQAREKLVAWMRARSVLVNCCASPQWKVLSGLHAWMAVKEDQDGKASIEVGKGTPVVTMVCSNCGQVRSFNVDVIFPEWRK